MHRRAGRPCDALGRTRAPGNAEVDDRTRRGRRHRRDGRRRITAAYFRRRRLYRAVCGDDFGRALAGICAGPGSPSRRAGGRRYRGRQAARDAPAIEQCRDQGARLHGPSLVAARRHGRSNRAPAALSAWRGSLPRPAVAGVGAVGRRCRCGLVAAACHLAGALERAEISPQGRRFHRARNCQGAGLGQVLALAEDAWLAADFPLDEPALKAIADQTVIRFTRDGRP